MFSRKFMEPVFLAHGLQLEKINKALIFDCKLSCNV
ncbi:hypothetical protein V6Z12_A02G061200 [Gossypium hirsutum]